MGAGQSLPSPLKRRKNTPPSGGNATDRLTPRHLKSVVPRRNERSGTLTSRGAEEDVVVVPAFQAPVDTALEGSSGAEDVPSGMENGDAGSTEVAQSRLQESLSRGGSTLVSGARSGPTPSSSTTAVPIVAGVPIVVGAAAMEDKETDEGGDVARAFSFMNGSKKRKQIDDEQVEAENGTDDPTAVDAAQVEGDAREGLPPLEVDAPEGETEEAASDIATIANSDLARDENGLDDHPTIDDKMIDDADNAKVAAADGAGTVVVGTALMAYGGKNIADGDYQRSVDPPEGFLGAEKDEEPSLFGAFMDVIKHADSADPATQAGSKDVDFSALDSKPTDVELTFLDVVVANHDAKGSDGGGNVLVRFMGGAGALFGGLFGVAVGGSMGCGVMITTTVASFYFRIIQFILRQLAFLLHGVHVISSFLAAIIHIAADGTPSSKKPGAH